MTTTLEILDRLISFPTVSRSSNRDLIAYVTNLFDGAGIAWELVESTDGSRANLFASVGPKEGNGVLLSGHTDVVPTEGQSWSRDPFRLHAENGRLYGRGTADMKGFVASALSAALKAATLPLRTPLHLALSYDEEIGCVGVRDLLAQLKTREPKPAFCIVGEPTGMRIANGHKGKLALRACCTGRAGHSALAPRALNALHLGADFIDVLRGEQHRLATSGARDDAYDIPYSTVHAGLMHGGSALNIVPECCEVDFEIRNLSADDPTAIVARIAEGVEAIVASLRGEFPEATIRIDEINAYPGLDTPHDSEIVKLLGRIGARPEIFKVAFGTEAGLFHNELGMAAAICGPGDMAQGHKADEYIEMTQIDACDAALSQLIEALQFGVSTNSR
uniref:acetylornithine deacetylase n=1 Tax=Neorhizobium sp. EC2-8 TaxID=3129230 RepID=UPI0031015C87